MWCAYKFSQMNRAVLQNRCANVLDVQKLGCAMGLSDLWNCSGQNETA